MIVSGYHPPRPTRYILVTKRASDPVRASGQALEVGPAQISPSESGRKLLAAIALLNVVHDGFLAFHGAKKLWIVQM